MSILLGSLLLGGCSLQSSTPTAEQKLQESVVTKTGSISTKVGDEYLLNTTDGIVNITSTKVDLNTYLKKQIKVTGMFSGSTLYVDKVELTTTN